MERPTVGPGAVTATYGVVDTSANGGPAEWADGIAKSQGYLAE
jgi:hypothetical protein